MSVEFSMANVVASIFSLLMVCLAFFVRLWMSRQQVEIDSVKSKHTALEKEFHAYQLASALMFAQKPEVSDGRKELMVELSNINKKIDNITDKLDKKADKP